MDKLEDLHEAILDRIGSFKGLATISALLFSGVTILHIARLINGWIVTVGSWTIPFEVSWIAILVAGILALAHWRLLIIEDWWSNLPLVVSTLLLTLILTFIALTAQLWIVFSGNSVVISGVAISPVLHLLMALILAFITFMHGMLAIEL